MVRKTRFAVAALGVLLLFGTLAGCQKEYPGDPQPKPGESATRAATVPAKADEPKEKPTGRTSEGR